MEHCKPNIVFLLIDDLGWKDVGFMGSTYYETPRMDQLAGQGMVFNSAYANPNCSPTRASLMTGLYTPRHGVYTVASPERGAAHLRKLELYDLETDMGEKHNLVEELPEQTEELYQLMLNWREAVQAPVPVELNPAYGAKC
ncbi:sulfatase-like hydrolase/transferase [Paenibacillus foliorum]|uniref:sulfatase-like hydrolase/transferase n=1 Tax=Paenibacillus foliorum TaxID=2654974 RepID=UPI001C11871E|nr:sulfatase-like hydrolase/transferase [Paenibacillus foliorum]